MIPGVQEIQARAIEDESERGKGYVVVLIPKSDYLPHRSMQDHHCHHRVGSSFHIVEHSILDSMFGRRPKPVLVVNPFAKKVPDAGSQYRYHNEICVNLKNIGRGSAKFPFCKIEVNSGNCAYESSYEYRATKRSIVRVENNPEILHPDMELEIMKFKFENENLDIIRFNFTVYCENCKPFEMIHYCVFSNLPRADYVDESQIPKFFEYSDRNQITDIKLYNLDNPEKIPNNYSN